MGKREESTKIKKILEDLITSNVEKLCKPCFRLYKAQLQANINNGDSTCSVRLNGDGEILILPFSQSIRSLTEGAFVWVATIYNNFSNAIVVAPIDFSDSDVAYFNQTLSPNDSWRINLNKKTIQLITINSSGTGIYDSYVYISTMGDSQLGQSGLETKIFNYSQNALGQSTVSFVRMPIDYAVVIQNPTSSSITVNVCIQTLL